MTIHELVTLLDDDSTPTHRASKAGVHGSDTPLHLVLSCYLLNPAGGAFVNHRELIKNLFQGVDE